MNGCPKARSRNLQKLRSGEFHTLRVPLPDFASQTALTAISTPNFSPATTPKNGLAAPADRAPARRRRLVLPLPSKPMTQNETVFSVDSQRYEDIAAFGRAFLSIQQFSGTH
jgi:hypothetical protein